MKTILLLICGILFSATIAFAQNTHYKKESLKLASKEILKLIIQEKYNFFEPENLEETVEDINVLRDYNLKDDLNELEITEEVINDCLIFKKNEEEVLLGFFKDPVLAMDNNQEYYKIFKFSACTKLSTLKRTELKVCYIENDNNPVIQNRFDDIKQIDINMGNMYKDYLSDRFSYLKNMEMQNLEEFTVSQSMEERLIQIVKKYEIPYRIYLKDGILFIDILIEGGLHSTYNDEDLSIMCSCMSVIEEILDVFINNI